MRGRSKSKIYLNIVLQEEEVRVKFKHPLTKGRSPQ